MSQRIVLAYSGGLDTSVAIPWLKERHDAEVVAVALDLGQGRELSQIRERAMAAGAVRCHVLDVREEFARDYILPALQADALYEGRFPLTTALGRPLIARKLVEIAHMENAPAIAHGCSAAGNDQMRIDESARALDPGITVLAPAREWTMTPPEEIEYASTRNIAVPAAPTGAYSTDRNLWGRSIHCGSVEDARAEPPTDIYTLTKPPAGAPDAPASVEIDWQSGVPVAVSGVEMSLVELIGSLEIIAGVHGVGRIDMAGNDTARRNRPEEREVYEAPAALLLHIAHRELEELVSDRDLQRVKQRLSQEYADIIYNGLWFSPTRPAIDAFMQHIQQRVTGSIRLKLFKGECRVVGRMSPFAIDGRRLATEDPGDTRDRAAAVSK